MPQLTEWIKPNGSKVDLNDTEASVAYATKAGWKPYGETTAGVDEARALLAAREIRAEAVVLAAKNAEAVNKRTKIPK